MKRALVVLGVLAMFAVPTLAQDLVSAGSIFLEGSSGLGFDYLSYTFEPEEGDSTSATEMNLDLTGKLGYFVIDGLAVGPVLNVGYNSYTYEDEDPITTMSYGGGIWGGYYFDLGGAFLPYGALGFLFQGSSTSYTTTDATGDSVDVTDSTILYGPVLWAGGLLSFAEGWVLDLGIEFDYLFGSNEVGDGDTVTTDLTVMDIGLNVGIGVFF